MIQYCEFPLCSRISDREGFCFIHAKHFAGKRPPKIKIPIPKMSAKRKVVQKEYKQVVKGIIKADTVCKIGAPGCTQKPSGLHHLQKRSPANLTKVSNLIPCCSSCNLWVEENSKEATEKGFSISKFKK